MVEKPRPTSRRSTVRELRPQRKKDEHPVGNDAISNTISAGLIHIAGDPDVTARKIDHIKKHRN